MQGTCLPNNVGLLGLRQFKIQCAFWESQIAHSMDVTGLMRMLMQPMGKGRYLHAILLL